MDYQDLSVTKPTLAITMGEPAGVGPELCLKLLAEPTVRLVCVPIVFGDAGVLRQLSRRLGLSMPNVLTLDQSWANTSEPSVLDFGLLDSVTPGVIGAHTGRASSTYVESAIDAALRGDVAGIVTGPIHKEAFHQAGVPFPGHTEMLATRTQASRVCMMLTSEIITCSVATAHIGFDEILRSLTTQCILDAIELTHTTLQTIRQRNVHLTVCGLNPHAGEHGLFGNGEEQDLIIPAIDAARDQGISLEGPVPPDTAFTPAIRAATDGYICMYHDQGLIPLKTLAFDTAVNVTLGLPIVRTSVDHGTALDIAWQGKASSTSFLAAIVLAAKLAANTATT